MPASAQRACYGSNWHDSQRDPPPQIQLADISSTAAQTALTPQTSASCQPLPIGSDTQGPPAPTSLFRKFNCPSRLAGHQKRGLLSQQARDKQRNSLTKAIRSRSYSQYTQAELRRLLRLGHLGNPESGQTEKIRLRPGNAAPLRLNETNSQ